ncbi:hypothetical protein E2C01_015820 [Portunus trituberculatus]|uniref:Uncharacterized protein n=1 Tax=Portunus trituberculatus TaxID=210409 RepID=A0A5B7DP86_PORTR|nr:hypothetical protein [Portunus trituberculatus]
MTASRLIVKGPFLPFRPSLCCLPRGRTFRREICRFETKAIIRQLGSAPPLTRRMRQLPKGTTLVDGEGFPQGMAVTSVDGRDKESGELITTKIQYLRKRLDLRLSPRIDSLLSADLLHPRLSEGRKFSGFRIQQFTRGRAWEGPWHGSSIRNLGPQLQTCVHMKGGAPVHYTRRPIDPRQPSLDVVRRNDYSVRQAFRVPKESLPKASIEQPLRNKNTICINIWEEFLFGKSVISSFADRTGPNNGQGEKEGQQEAEEEELEDGIITYVRKSLGQLLPKFVVDLLVYTAYFLIFFASCVGYNMFCELGCYILLAQHLKIHEKAYEKKLDVEFTGSIFQGPLYALTRNWCEHCNERDRGLVMRRLMKKMKADILPVTNTASTPQQDTTRDPP